MHNLRRSKRAYLTKRFIRIYGNTVSRATKLETVLFPSSTPSQISLGKFYISARARGIREAIPIRSALPPFPGPLEKERKIDRLIELSMNMQP